MTVAALECRAGSQTFGGVRAIEAVSCAVPAGSLTALIGPNGAGKTTLFNAATNLFPPSSGEVLLFGKRAAGLSPHRIAADGIVRTFQTARVFPGMTTLANGMAGAHLHIRGGALGQMCWTPAARREERRVAAKAEALLDLIHLGHARDRATADLPIGAQKLVEIARALMA